MVNFLHYVFMLFFSFSIFSNRRLLKIENENNNTKTLTTDVSYMGVGSLEFRFIYGTNPGWLELPLTGTNFHGSKHVRATEVLLYYLTSL